MLLANGTYSTDIYFHLCVCSLGIKALMLLLVVLLYLALPVSLPQEQSS